MLGQTPSLPTCEPVWLMGGSLKTGVSLAQVAMEVDAISRTLEREYSESRRRTATAGREPDAG